MTKHLKTPSTLIETLNHPIFKQLTRSPIGVLNDSGEFIYFNKAAEDITGFSEKEIAGTNIVGLVTPNAQEVTNKYYKTMKPGLLAEHVIIEWVKRDGGSCFIEWKSTTLYDRNDLPEYYFIIGEDITAHRQDVLNIKYAHQQFRDIVLGSNDFIWHLNSKLEFNFCSPGVTTLGYKENELLGKSLPDFLPPENISNSISINFPTDTRQQNITHTVKHKQGHELTFDTTYFPMLDTHGILKGYRGISRDITIRNALLEKLNDSERRHQHSQKASNFGIWEWNLDTGDLYWSDQIWTIFGLDKTSHLPALEIFMNCIHPDDRKKMTNTISATSESSQQFELEYRIIWPDKSIHWIKSTGSVIHKKNGLIMAGLAINIDKQKITEQELMTYEYRYQQLFQYSSDAILISNKQGKIIDSNLSFNRLLQHNKASLQDKTLMDLCIHCCPHCHLMPVEVPLIHGEVTICETSILQADRSLIPVEIRRSSIELGNELIIQAIIQDLRPQQQKDLEQKSQFEEQRAALIREVHHRIKNNLQGIVGLMRYNQDKNILSPKHIISQAIKQLHSIALVFGIQGQTGDRNVTLESLIKTVSQNQIKAKKDIVELNINSCEPLSINDSDIIPFCLILNELIVNAIKHKKSDCNTVTVTYQCRNKECVSNQYGSNKSAHIKISTPGGLLPHHFNFVSNQGLGTGLGLALSLMPQKGMVIQYKQTKEGVETSMTLSHPVINS